MENQFGDRIKQLREANNLLQRQVASALEIDTPMLSKIERGERKAKKEQVIQLADLYKANKEDLLTLWLADQIFETIEGNDQAENAISLVSKKISKKDKRK